MDAEIEPGLDPAAERLRRKLGRLLLVSGGFMTLGFIAVFAAIVYKVGHLGERAAGLAPAGPMVEASIAIPAGARLATADLDGGHALLRLEGADGAPVLLLVDLASGRVLGRYRLQAGP